MQYRLRTILLLFVAASVALAAMRSASAAWASSIVTATVLAMLASIALAIGSGRRSFWIGFAVCGTGYFAVVMTPIPPQITDHLATSQAMRFLRDKFLPQPAYRMKNPPTPTASEYIAMSAEGEEWNSRATNFRWIGECIWTLILGALGGVLVRFVAGRRGRESAGHS
jgi:hypothetical protein